MTYLSVASMRTSAAAFVSSPTAAIVSLSMSTSARLEPPALTTVPFWISVRIRSLLSHRVRGLQDSPRPFAETPSCA